MILLRASDYNMTLFTFIYNSVILSLKLFVHNNFYPISTLQLLISIDRHISIMTHD